MAFNFVKKLVTTQPYRSTLRTYRYTQVRLSGKSTVIPAGMPESSARDGKLEVARVLN